MVPQPSRPMQPPMVWYVGVCLHLLVQTISAIEHSVVVDLRNRSPVQGIVNRSATGKTVTEFLGIPFAEPPVGNLRFRKPVPKRPWGPTLQAFDLPNACIQTKDYYWKTPDASTFHGAEMWNANTKLSEDCLYLNVWVPGRVDPKKRLTTMVWIYGGGFWSGCSTLEVYDGKVLASEENVIIVSMNYRVSLFGFLYLGRDDAPGNAGLWDQLLAMKWVKENIEFFGGNPDDITIFGESAGSASVSMHVISPRSAPYFSRAIMQSSTVTAPWAMEDRTEQRNRVLLLSDSLNCGPTIHDPEPDFDKVMTCLRRANATILKEKEWITFEFCDFPWVPVVDGDFFTESPRESLKRGNFKKSQILVGSNFDESMYFLVYHLQDIFSSNLTRIQTQRDFILNDETWRKSVERTLPKKLNNNPAIRNAILFEYLDRSVPVTAQKRQQAIDKLFGDYHFTCSVNEFAQMYQSHGGKVYYYYFTHIASEQTWPSWMGVLHGYEINFIFGEPLIPKYAKYTEAEKELSRRFMKYWANFARTGDPNWESAQKRSTMETWPQYGKEQKYMTMTVNEAPIGYGPRIRQCAFWKEYIPQLYIATATLTEMEQRWKEQFRRWEEDYIVEWRFNFEQYKRMQGYSRLDMDSQNCAHDDL